MIDNHLYSEKSTKEELEMLKKSISLNDNTIYYHQVVSPNSFIYQFQFERIRELTRDINSFYMIINVMNTKRANAEYREIIKNEMISLKPELKFVVIASGKRIWTNVIAKVIMRKAGMDDFEVVTDIKQAEAKLKTLIKE